jgi:homoserine O-succinyltransferase/O-acetyltransferase
MPIKIPNKLPAKKILEKENIFVMDKQRAIHQDIRPLKIALVNLMPTTIETETQIIRMLSNTPLQIEFELIHMASHRSTHTDKDHFTAFYKTFNEIKNQRFDGLIITGAPVEHLEFQEVDYWQELLEIMEWAEKNVTSTLFLCWAAQAGLYHYYGVNKYTMKKKIFGVFSHQIVNQNAPLLRGFDNGFLVPHSRHTEVLAQDIKKIKELEILALSSEAGLHIVSSKDGRKIFVIGHSEYDSYTLHNEYKRDKAKGLSIALPENYYPSDDWTKTPINTWHSHGFLFYSNWINYSVYQITPYDWIDNKPLA